MRPAIEGFKLYPVIWLQHRELREASARAGVARLMCSYWEKPHLDIVHKYRSQGVEVLLDSGAYSAWGEGKRLILGTYIDFLQEYGHLYTSYFCLDRIPGSRFRPPRTRAEVEEAAAISYKNLRAMKAAGLKPIPVFRMADSRGWLLRLLDDGESYIGLSLWKSAGLNRQTRWLDAVFGLLTDSNGVPLVKIHGLAVTSHRLLFRYPWHTTDSSTWAKVAANGGIRVPAYRDGKPDYSLPPHQLTVSRANGRSWRRWPVPRDVVADYLERHCETTIDTVTRDTNQRHFVNALFFKRLEATINVKRGLSP